MHQPWAAAALRGPRSGRAGGRAARALVGIEPALRPGSRLSPDSLCEQQGAATRARERARHHQHSSAAVASRHAKPAAPSPMPIAGKRYGRPPSRPSSPGAATGGGSGSVAPAA